MKLKILISVAVIIHVFLISECIAKDNQFTKDGNKLLQEILHRQESELNEAFLPKENIDFTGIHETHYANGNKKSEVAYKYGKLNGLAIWWLDNGQKDRERSYIDGKINGLETQYITPNGNKTFETTYKDGKKNGLEIIFNEAGHKVQQNNYKDDKKDGLTTPLRQTSCRLKF